MAGARFLEAQTCTWTQGLRTSSLSSTPGTREFRIEIVLLLDWLPTKAAESSLPKDVWLFRRNHFFPLILGGPKFEASVCHLNPLATRPHDNLHEI